MNDLFKGKFGLEREALRIDKMAVVSSEKHPNCFKEDNPYITKDFAEAQIEMITPPKDSIDSAINTLEDIQQVVLENLGFDEMLWKQSNPPIIDKARKIEIAKFKEDSNKEEYRKYLSNKYGVEKSVISGIHYNFSFSEDLLNKLYKENKDKYLDYTDFKNKQYLKVSKYLLKNRWFYIYLTNASPIFHNSFYKHCVNMSDQLNTGDCHIDGLYSLRNSKCGYRNKEDIILDFSSFENYQKNIQNLIMEKAIKNESELYTPVRLKANEDNNIEYLELRFIDINPFTISGVSDIDLKYIHLHMIYALFSEDFDFTKELQLEANHKHNMASRNDNNYEILALMNDLHNEVKEYFTNIKSPYNLNEIFEVVEERITNEDKTYAYRLKKAYSKSSYIDYHLEQSIRDKKYCENNTFALASDNSLELSTKILIKEAIKSGYIFEILDSSANFISLYDIKTKRLEYVQQASKTNLDKYANILAMENKVVTKKILADHAILVPFGYKITLNDDLSNYDFSKYENNGVVIKPNTTNFGEGITIFPNGANNEQIVNAINFAFKKDSTVLIEDYIKGLEYRFLVIDGKVVGVLHRRAANIVGDGKSTIEKLVKLKNQNPLRGDNYTTPLEKIKLEAKEKEFLKLQGLNINSIIEDGSIVYLRENSNISTGGDSIDYTDIVDESYIKLAEKSAAALGVNIAGVDMIIENIEVKANNSNYSILELNFNPAIHIHTYPLVGKNREPAKYILEALFK